MGTISSHFLILVTSKSRLFSSPLQTKGTSRENITFLLLVSLDSLVIHLGYIPETFSRILHAQCLQNQGFEFTTRNIEKFKG